MRALRPLAANVTRLACYDAFTTSSDLLLARLCELPSLPTSNKMHDASLSRNRESHVGLFNSSWSPIVEDLPESHREMIMEAEEGIRQVKGPSPTTAR